MGLLEEFEEKKLCGPVIVKNDGRNSKKARKDKEGKMNMEDNYCLAIFSSVLF